MDRGICDFRQKKQKQLENIEGEIARTCLKLDKLVAVTHNYVDWTLHNFTSTLVFFFICAKIGDINKNIAAA